MKLELKTTLHGYIIEDELILIIKRFIRRGGTIDEDKDPNILNNWDIKRTKRKMKTLKDKLYKIETDYCGSIHEAEINILVKEMVKEAIVNFKETNLVYCPVKNKCSNCESEINIFYEKWNKNNYKLFINCQDCYLKHIFGDFEK